MSAFERVRAEDVRPGDLITSVRTIPPVKVESLGRVGLRSRFINLEGNTRIRPRHDTKFWRVV